MDDDAELRALRDRVAALEDLIDGLETGGVGGAARLCKTKRLATYPTGTAVFVALEPCRVLGTEGEGNPVNLVGSGATLFGANLGSLAVPVDTVVLAADVPDRLAFIYNG